MSGKPKKLLYRFVFNGIGPGGQHLMGLDQIFHRRYCFFWGNDHKTLIVTSVSWFPFFGDAVALVHHFDLIFVIAKDLHGNQIMHRHVCYNNACNGPASDKGSVVKSLAAS